MEEKMSTIENWMTSAIQKECQPKDLKILEIVRSSGSQATDNFIGQLEAVEVKARVDESLKLFHYMIKGIPEDKAEFMKKVMAFEKEANMYDLVMPVFKEMGDKIGLHSPKCYFISESSGVIVMENLKKKGFTMMSAKFGMKTQHIHWALDEFARLHAYSHALFGTERGDEFKGSMKCGEIIDISDMKEVFEAIFRGQVKALNYVGRPDLGKLFEVIIPEAMSKITAGLSSNKSVFSVLNHGDGWTNNFMFKHDEKGGIDEGILLDWQFPIYGSPATDLAMFFEMSIAPKEKEERTTELLSYYHQRLTYHCKAFDLNLDQIYPMHKLQEEYKLQFPCIYFVAAQMIPILYMDIVFKGEDSDLNFQVGDEGISMWEELSIKIAKESPEFKQILIDFHEYAARRGCI